MKIKEQILANGKSYHATNEAKLLEFGPHGQIRNGLVFTAMFLMNKPPKQNVTYLLSVPQSDKYVSIPKFTQYQLREYHNMITLLSGLNHPNNCQGTNYFAN